MSASFNFKKAPSGKIDKRKIDTMEGNIPSVKEHFSSNAAPKSPVKSSSKISDNCYMLVLENRYWRKGLETEDTRATLIKTSALSLEHQRAMWHLKDLEHANLDDFPEKVVDSSNFDDFLNYCSFLGDGLSRESECHEL